MFCGGRLGARGWLGSASRGHFVANAIFGDIIRELSRGRPAGDAGIAEGTSRGATNCGGVLFSGAGFESVRGAAARPCWRYGLLRAGRLAGYRSVAEGLWTLSHVGRGHAPGFFGRLDRRSRAARCQSAGERGGGEEGEGAGFGDDRDA